MTVASDKSPHNKLGGANAASSETVSVFTSFIGEVSTSTSIAGSEGSATGSLGNSAGSVSEFCSMITGISVSASETSEFSFTEELTSSPTSVDDELITSTVGFSS